LQDLHRAPGIFVSEATGLRNGIASTPESGGRHLHPAQTQLPDHPERLHHDRARHLRLSDAAIDEDDGDLLEAHAGAERAVLHLDLEAVAVRRHAIEIDRVERPAVPADEAGRDVTHAHAEHGARVEAAAAADQLPAHAPVLGAAALHPARSDDDVDAVLRAP